MFWYLAVHRVLHSMGTFGTRLTNILPKKYRSRGQVPPLPPPPRGRPSNRLEGPTVDQEERDSVPPAAVSKLKSFIPLCTCLLEETLTAVGPLYRVFVPGEVNDPTQRIDHNHHLTVSVRVVHWDALVTSHAT